MTNQRKHRQQMTLREIARVENLVHAQTCWIGDGPHVNTLPLRGREVSVTEAYDTLRTGQVIEVNRNKDLCVLMRKNYADHAVCVVVNLLTKWIVTMWQNRIGDNHSTLDLNQYQWKVDLISELKDF